jgi:hypothetical protein
MFLSFYRFVDIQLTELIGLSAMALLRIATIARGRGNTASTSMETINGSTSGAPLSFQWQPYRFGSSSDNIALS